MNRRSLLVLGSMYVAIALVVVACSKSTSPMSGGGGGGGGTTGPTFDLHFPATGTSQSLTFTDVGSWGYQCTPHGSCCGMTGTVVVNASTGADSALVNVGQGGNNFVPATVTIKPGAPVRWVNVSASTIHTATRS